MINEEELIARDFDNNIKEFENSIIVLNKSLKTNCELKTHNIEKIMSSIKYIANSLFKEYWEKEKAHQNTSSVKEKYFKLMNLIKEYDTLLLKYKEKFPNSNIESFRQTMRRFNTGKVSVKTEIFNY